MRSERVWLDATEGGCGKGGVMNREGVGGGGGVRGWLWRHESNQAPPLDRTPTIIMGCCGGGVENQQWRCWCSMLENVWVEGMLMFAVVVVEGGGGSVILEVRCVGVVVWWCEGMG